MVVVSSVVAFAKEALGERLENADRWSDRPTDRPICTYRYLPVGTYCHAHVSTRYFLARYGTSFTHGVSQSVAAPAEYYKVNTVIDIS